MLDHAIPETGGETPARRPGSGRLGAGLRKATAPSAPSPDANRWIWSLGPRATCRTHRLVAGAEVEDPEEDGRCVPLFDAQRFKDLCAADVVGQNDPVAVAVLAPVTAPGRWQRAVSPAVASPESGVVEFAGRRVGPAGAGAGGERDPTSDPGVDLVPAVEVDPVPVDEARTGPACGEPQRVVLEHRPDPPPRDAPGTGVEPNRHPLVGEVGAVVADLGGERQGRAVIHRQPGLDGRRPRPARVPFRQPREIRAVGRNVPRRIVGLEIRLADVVDDVVLLLGDHPRLPDHPAESVGQRLIHPKRVRAVLERPGAEPRRRRQRAGPLLRAVAVGADPDVNRLAPAIVLIAQAGDHSRVVHVLLVVGQGGDGERRFRRPQRQRAPPGRARRSQGRSEPDRGIRGDRKAARPGPPASTRSSRSSAPRPPRGGLRRPRRREPGRGSAARRAVRPPAGP